MVIRSPWPEIERPSGSLAEAVLRGAGQFGDQPAVIEAESGRSLTYRQLGVEAERVAAGLARAGLEPGQPVAVALPSTIDFVLAWYGTLLAGGWMVPISPLNTSSEMEHLIVDSGARILIGTPENAGVAGENVEQRFVTGGNWEPLRKTEGARPDVRVKPEDLAILPYSSGTTGKPKGVMLTHFNLVANLRQIMAAGWPEQGDVIVNMMPLYHVAGLNAMLNTFLTAGGTVVLMRRFDLERYLALSAEHGASFLGCPPPVILALTKSPLWDRYRPPRLKRGICGAAPLGAELQEAFERRTGVWLGQVWGMTEASAAISNTGTGRMKKFGSCGHLLPSTEAQVVDVVTQRPLPRGETGEIWLRGPQVMQGYWKQPRATAETLVGEGWMRTGDIGYADAEDAIFLVDRLKELIKYNALQVAPAELEDVIQAHPAVQDAAVVGAPDEAAGEIPMAFVVRKAGARLEAEELMRYVADRVAPHKKVRAVAFLEEIPKSPTGKILRRVLKERVSRREAAGA